MEFDNIETLKRAVEINAGFSLLPEPTVAREVQTGTLVAIPLANVKMVRPLGILHRCGVDLGATARRFIQFLLEYATVDRVSRVPGVRPGGWQAERRSSRAQRPGSPADRESAVQVTRAES